MLGSPPVDTLTVADALARVPMFSGLSADERRELASRTRVRRFGKDEVVFHRDDPATHLYVTLTGTLKVTLADEVGHETVVALVRDGETFGELALFDDAPRSATVTALTDTTAVLVARDDFLQLVERSPHALRHALGLLARTIRRLSTRVEDLVFLDVPGRVAKRLLDLSEIGGGASRSVALTQEDLAGFVGATRVSVNRVLADFDARGLVKVGRRKIDILKPDELRGEIRY